ncbi:protein shisa-4-like [Gigantopelta aegis]|uniref:protein shisa-4-like n=1 Tax=Gigantopelta aegis TaxID=1735272 RepID=UPI001B88A5B5|nr:protein shisa-4-like [Gigantopelta aegis]
MASSSWLLPFTVFLGFCLSGLEAILCRRTRTFNGLFENSIEYRYCPYSCCGHYYHQHCCGTRVGLIIGAVVGTVVLIVVVITVLCCFCCRRRRANGTLMTSSAPGTVVYQTSSTTSGYPMTTTTVQYPISPYNAPPPSYDQVAAPPIQTAVAHDNYGFKH